MARKDKKYDSLIEEYRALAKRADQRLVRLERYAHRPGYAEITKGAYSRAIKDIESWSGPGARRFNRGIPMNDRGVVDERLLKAKINDIKTFLRSDTSSLKPGIGNRGYSISSYEKAAKAFNQRYGGDLTWKEISNYYSKKVAKKVAAKIHSSKSVAAALGKFKELSERDPKASRASIMRDIKAGKDVILTDDKVLNEIMIRMVKEGVSPRTIRRQ